MDHNQRKLSGSREASKKPPFAKGIVLAVLGGMVIGSAGTYFLSRPPAPTQSTSPAGGAPMIAVPPQQALTPQPPGEAPPGKVWSAEHGHWHDAPAGLTIPPAPSPAQVIPAAPTPPAPAQAPLEKKE